MSGVVVTDPTTGAVLATWPRALDPRLSPCRPDPAKGVRQHPCSRAHAEVVAGFRAWAAAAAAQAEAATLGYATELADYWSTRRRPSFRDYLLGVGRTVGEAAA